MGAKKSRPLSIPSQAMEKPTAASTNQSPAKRRARRRLQGPRRRMEEPGVTPHGPKTALCTTTNSTTISTTLEKRTSKVTQFAQKPSPPSRLPTWAMEEPTAASTNQSPPIRIARRWLKLPRKRLEEAEAGAIGPKIAFCTTTNFTSTDTAREERTSKVIQFAQKPSSPSRH